ncbi:MAG: hypothetical protein ISR51_05815 [Rhodospirillales bacterium]|nr:hypothetical protein [Alphaproteobacteria bacterium]MBL6948174.1 hypothetical protein [Rhodospirillales bacterium]
MFQITPILKRGLALVLAGLLSALAAPSPAQAAAVNKCTRLLPTGGREIIINQCNKCRIVHITRLRAGNALPMSRIYNVQPKSKIDLSFRGPGRSRITAELPCKGDPGAPVNLAEPERDKKNSKKDKQCVAMEKIPGGGVQLVNSCKVCKAALIERQDVAGANGRRQAYKVSPKTPVPVPANGAAQVALLAEVACPKP